MPNVNLISWTSREVQGGKKYHPRKTNGKPPSHIESFVVKPLAAWLESHPCIGARKLGAERTFYACVLGEMTKISTSLDFLLCLDEYFKISDEQDPIFKTLLVIFTDSISSKEKFFEKFWGFSQQTHDLDALTHLWDETVSRDVTNDAFELSFRSRAVFPTTIHPYHDRPARRFQYPGWAHNQSKQFDELRRTGEFERWQRKIRTADSSIDPSGTHNPLLTNKGDASSAAQLGQLEADEYPFSVRSRDDRDQLLVKLKARAINEKAFDVVSYIETLET